MVGRLPILAGVALALGSCTGGESGKQAEPAPTDLEPIDLLIRASLDVRGVRPSVAEIERVEREPEAVEAMLDDFLADERFEARVRDLYAEVTLTRTEAYAIDLSAFDLQGASQTSILEAIGDEPQRLIGHVAANDLPLTELTTADYTFATEVSARMWPVDYPDGGTGWKKVHYTDGRPAAGLLAMNGMWWRYQSTDSNANRKRANQVSRILLCHDYLNRPIEFDRNVNLLDEEAVSDAIRNNPACVNCHVSLDPMASYFFGFWAYSQAASDIAEYHPSREQRWEDYTGVPPGYFGEPGSSLGDLGRQIAADNRFPECMVEHAYELLLRRDVELADWSELTEHREALLDGGMTLKPLFRSVMNSSRYRAGTDEGLPGAVPLKMATPALLASQIEDLTGFRWTDAEGWDLILSEQRGYLTLAGGADGFYVTSPSDSPNTTVLLVQERLAEGAASHVVLEDLDRPAAQRKLFTDVDFSETPDTGREAMARQIQALHLRIFGNRVDADGEEVTANLELWTALYELEGDPIEAWSGLLSALLRDPDLLFY